MMGKRSIFQDAPFVSFRNYIEQAKQKGVLPAHISILRGFGNKTPPVPPAGGDRHDQQVGYLPQVAWVILLILYLNGTQGCAYIARWEEVSPYILLP